MNKEELLTELKVLGLELSEDQLKKIDEFCNILLSENKKYNLTAIKEYDQVLLKHVYDSLTIVKVVDLNQSYNLLDIGSGGGFPGIILKIVFPHLEITLLDSNGKKTKFLELVKETLSLNGLTIINSRAEEYVIEKRESFDVVTARAVSDLNILLELSVPYQKIDGLFIAMKANAEEEIKNPKSACKILKCEIKDIIEFELPIDNSRRTLITVIKQDKTPSEYPRGYDKILKKPLIINQK